MRRAARRGGIEGRSIRLAWCPLLVAATFVASGVLAPVAAQEAVRPEIGRPLQAAQQLVGARRFGAALAKVREADAAGPRTPNERALIERMRIAAALGAGEIDVAARAYDALAADGTRPGGAEAARTLEAIAAGYYRAGQYARAAQWAERGAREGAASPALRALQIRSLFQAGDVAAAQRELTRDVTAVERSGGTPADDTLRLLLAMAQKQGDAAAFDAALEKILAHHPTPADWATRLDRLQRRPGFAGRLTLDRLRLLQATGGLKRADDVVEMAQLALQADAGAEARRVVEQGYATGVLGNGPDAARHERLRALVARASGDAARTRAADADSRVAAALDRAYAGDAKAAAVAIRDALAGGGLKRPDDARLHLAIAQWLAGDRAGAIATFRAVGGSDGTADLARLWTLHLRRGS
ncbi:hypothetical protein HQN59_04125 [Schlegelella sp. ID0723]|uniref:Tetratricopeptide repeat protein n=1 Tax=Piscinibacter koreensis TaxID=2742824 RepID=A0A7Y6NKL4_9BURK|nr:hypothetical protein [Schlegelella koreensis]